MNVVLGKEFMQWELNNFTNLPQNALHALATFIDLA